MWYSMTGHKIWVDYSGNILIHLNLSRKVKNPCSIFSIYNRMKYNRPEEYKGTEYVINFVKI